MNLRRSLFVSTALMGCLPWAGCAAPSAKHKQHVQQDKPIVYPDAPTVDQVDVMHGVKVSDPYRWLEDTDSPQTKQWIEAENKITFDYLGTISVRDKIRDRLEKLWNYEKFGTPFKEGGRYFFEKNDGLQNQSVVYTMEKLDAEPRVLLDPNTLSKDGTIALNGYAISSDGKYMAYGLSDGGSDWKTLRVRDVATAKDTSDEIKWVKFSEPSWAKNGKGFFYSAYDTPKPGEELRSANYFHKLYFHELGTPQTKDQLVYERQDQKEWGFGGQVTDDGQYLIISVSQGTERKNRVYYKNLAIKDAPIVRLLDDFDAQYSFVDNDGPVFWFFTDQKAPRGRLIAIDTRNPEREKWREIIPQSAETLEGVSLVNDMFIATYLKDAHSQVKMFNFDGKVTHEVQLPGIGSAAGFSGKRHDKETFYSYNSFNMPSTIYRLDLTNNQSTIFKQPKVDINPEDFVTTQVFYPSKDGTKIPMFITHKKGLKRNGANPTYLYGYGGFDISLTPRFSIANLVWMEMGGIYAQANLRGGGEYGKEWHDAGRLKKKQNVFDDFISAGEYLIKEKYTSKNKLAIGGGSNGGLLVGACLTQRPDLFGAALPQVGVLDMLRFQLFTIGWAWVSDYGASTDPEMFRVLHAYSPYHNIKPKTQYPATMITTGDHDDRVVPGHSFKFAAALQAAQAGKAPVLIRIETRAGHGAGKPTKYIIDEAADRWAFLVRALKIDDRAVMANGQSARSGE